MIEKIILDYLTGAGVTAYMEIPDGGGVMPYVVIEKTGGGDENHINSATVAIQSYGDTLYQAALLNDQIVALMEDIVLLPEVSACELNSDYNFTDTTKKEYRYQAVFDLVYFA